MRSLLPVLPLLATACAADVAPPRLDAHRAGAGYWPQNSRTAVEEAIALGVSGLEVDLALTDDREPILWPTPSLTSDRCTRADGAEMRASVLVKTHALSELRAGWLCGGVPDPDHRNALVVADTLMSLDQLLRDLDDADPELVVHLDIGWEPGGVTWKATGFAEAVLDRWFAADPPQGFTISSPYSGVLAAFDAHARTWGRDLELYLEWPDPDEAGAGLELRQLLGGVDYGTIAADAGADGLVMPWEVADLQAVRAAAADGVRIRLEPVNDPGALDAISGRWPVDAVLTDYPGHAL